MKLDPYTKADEYRRVLVGLSPQVDLHRLPLGADANRIPPVLVQRLGTLALAVQPDDFALVDVGRVRSGVLLRMVGLTILLAAPVDDDLVAAPEVIPAEARDAAWAGQR